MPPSIFLMRGFKMTHVPTRFAGVLALLLMSTSAQAQVTADQVWQKWKDMTASFGQTITTASEERQGDTLVISGLAFATENEGGSVSGTIEKVNLRELGDGTVEITMSPEYPMTVVNQDPESGKVVINLTVRQPDLKVIASGDDAETAYDLAAPSVKVTVKDVTVADKPFDLKLDVDVTALAGKYLMSGGDAGQMTSNLTADGAGLKLAVNDPDSSSVFNMTANVTQLAGTSTSAMAGADMTNMAEALAAGFSANGDFTYGKMDLAFDGNEAGSTGAVKATLDGGNMTFAMDKEHMQYGGASKNLALTASGSDIPFPELAIKYADAAFNFVMPVLKSETPGDFAVLTRIVDLTISDEVWDMADPGKQLPRDPATVVIDTKGKANWLVEIMDETAAAAMAENEVPAQIHALDIVDLTLKAVGAEVTGTGNLTFDNSDLVTFQGMPAPTGKVNLKITGANALLDKLIAMGLVPEDQAMGARMMMGLFAKQGEGEDTLTSELEFKEKGFYANGQRLQ